MTAKQVNRSFTAFAWVTEAFLNTLNLITGNTAQVIHIQCGVSVCQRHSRPPLSVSERGIKGKVIPTVVSITLERLLASWNMMTADSHSEKMPLDSHL